MNEEWSWINSKEKNPKKEIRKGSVVRCIDNSLQSRKFLEVGKLYTVESIVEFYGNTPVTMLHLEEDTLSNNCGWLVGRFKLADINDKISTKSKYRMIRR